MSELPSTVEPASSPMPVEYEIAIQALDACTSLDETKIWRSAADALAAWAKIFDSREAEIKAKRLRLYAYRRMAEIANDLRPSGRINVTGGSKGCGGKLPGAVSLLREHGLSKTQADAANFIARLPKEQFERIMEHPLSPTTVAHQLWGRDPVWMAFSRAAMILRSILRQHPLHEMKAIAHMLGQRQEGTLRVIVWDLRRMLREMEEVSGDDIRRDHDQ